MKKIITTSHDRVEEMIITLASAQTNKKREQLKGEGEA